MSATLTSGSTSPASKGKKNGTDRETLVVFAPEHSRTLNAGGQGRQDLDTETFVACVAPPLTSAPYADRGAADEGKLVVAFDPNQVTNPDNRSNPQPGAPCHTLPANAQAPVICFRGAGQDGFTPKDLSPALAASDGGGTIPSVIAFDGRARGDDGRGYERPPNTLEEVAPTLDTMKPPGVAYSFQTRIARNGRGDGGDVVPALTSEAGRDGRGDSAPCVAVRIHGSDERVVAGASLTEVSTAVRTKAPGQVENSSTTAAVTRYGVRRLTCVECEILQGFGPNYTLIKWGNKKRSPLDFAETFAYLRRHGFDEESAWELADTPDGPRYVAIGNSMATHVVRWIGEQIQLVDSIK